MVIGFGDIELVWVFGKGRSGGVMGLEVEVGVGCGGGK